MLSESFAKNKHTAWSNLLSVFVGLCLRMLDKIGVFPQRGGIPASRSNPEHWPRLLKLIEVKPLEEVVENRWGLAQQFITTERIEMRELSKGRVTASRVLEAQPGLLDDVVELGQYSRFEPLGLVEIRGPERPREVLSFSDDWDQELRRRFPDAPVAVPPLEVEGLPNHVSLLLSEDRARPHDSQYPRHFAATLTRIFASNAICGVKLL